MLVLNRKAGERIVINEEIEVTVTRIGHGRVQIGIAAPQSVVIRRAELRSWGGGGPGVEQDANQWCPPKRSG